MLVYRRVHFSVHLEKVIESRVGFCFLAQELSRLLKIAKRNAPMMPMDREDYLLGPLLEISDDLSSVYNVLLNYISTILNLVLIIPVNNRNCTPKSSIHE